MAGGTGRLTTQFDFGVTAARQQPGVVPFTNNFAQLSEDLGRVADAFGPMFNKIGAGKGQREGAAAAEAVAAGETVADAPGGKFFERILAPARYDAAQAAFGAGIKSDIDRQEKEIRSQFAFDPAGYKAASDAMIDGYISRAPSDWAMDVGGYVRDKANDGFGAVTKARTEKDQAENVATVQAREAEVRENILALAYEGKVGTKEYEDSISEYQLIQVQKGENPLFKWSPEMAAIEREKLDDEIGLQSTLFLATETYKAEGPAAATRVLESAFGFTDPKREARNAPKGSVVFAPPVGAKPGSPFGAVRPTGSHNGVDYPVPIGTPVASAAPGVVIGVGEDDTSGKFVRVRHPDGSISSYAHLDSIGVARGDTVDGGAVLGASGNTGNSTGPHLHFKLRDPSGKVVDPTKYYGKPAGEPLAGAAPEEPAPEQEAILAGLPPRLRQKYFREGMSHIRSLSAADIAETREMEAKDREQRAERREITASYKLDIITGAGADWRKDERLGDAERLSLERAEQAAVAAQRAEARRDEAEAKRAGAGTYDRFMKDAEKGILDDDALADAVQSGDLPRSRAESLRMLNNRALKHDVGIVRSGAPAWYSTKPPGWSAKTWKERKAQFDDGVADWLPRNLDADDARKKQAGENIGKFIYDPKAKVKPGGGAMTATDKLAQRRKLDEERRAGRISDATYQAKIRELGNS
jgi:murein DD-endopeptidase MepM/ murein hydrolase activator NlpD